MEFKRSELKFLQVNVKSITQFKSVITLYMPVLLFKHCHSVDSIGSISVDTGLVQLIQYGQFDPGKYCLLCL